MPELPEVETVVRTLRSRLIGRTVTGVTVDDVAVLRGTSPEEFARGLEGRSIRDLTRRGKHILADLDDDNTLMIHLGMTGQLILVEGTELPRFTRLVLHLGPGASLTYADMRKFGTLRLVPDPEPHLRGLGAEPLDAGIDPESLHLRLAGRTRSIKAVLLDQSLLAGIGNIYADEALFLAGIHPATPCGSLTLEQVQVLLRSVRTTLEQGIANRGTTFSDYRDGDGRPGDNQASLLAYGRAGQPCSRCGQPMISTRVAGRSSCFCPACQPEPTARTC